MFAPAEAAPDELAPPPVPELDAPDDEDEDDDDDADEEDFFPAAALLCAFSSAFCFFFMASSSDCVTVTSCMRGEVRDTDITEGEGQKDQQKKGKGELAAALMQLLRRYSLCRPQRMRSDQ